MFVVSSSFYQTFPFAGIVFIPFIYRNELINIITSTFWTAIGFLFGKGAIFNYNIFSFNVFICLRFYKIQFIFNGFKCFCWCDWIINEYNCKSLRGKERKYFYYFHFINYLFIFGCVNIFDFRNFLF